VPLAGFVTVWWFAGRGWWPGSTVLFVPVEFISDAEAAAFGRYAGPVPVADLERFFYLEDADRGAGGRVAGGSQPAGFALQVLTRHAPAFTLLPGSGA
jgi:hypothetical protein